jgi:hypothetical protein
MWMLLSYGMIRSSFGKKLKSIRVNKEKSNKIGVNISFILTQNQVVCNRPQTGSKRMPIMAFENWRNTAVEPTLPRTIEVVPVGYSCLGAIRYKTGGDLEMRDLVRKDLVRKYALYGQKNYTYKRILYSINAVISHNSLVLRSSNCPGYSQFRKPGKKPKMDSCNNCYGVFSKSYTYSSFGHLIHIFGPVLSFPDHHQSCI